MSDVAGPFSANAAELLPPSANIGQSASGRKTSRLDGPVRLLLGSAVLLSAVVAGPSITSARAADSVENSETGPASGSPQASKSPKKASIVASKKRRSAQTAKLHRMSLALNAQAADRPIPVADWRARTTDWTGFYAGIHAGLGTDTSSSSDTWNWLNSYPTGSIVGLNGGPLAVLTAPLTTNTAFANQYHHSSIGFLGGVQAGYNWQFSRIVVGFEADWSGTTQRDTVGYSAQPVAGQFPPVPNFFFVPGTTQGWKSEEKISWLSTWRARVGVTSDSSLWYLTGGGAAGRIQTNYTLFSSPGSSGLPAAVGPLGAGTFAQWGLPGGVTTGSFGTTKMGWTLGAGVETSIDSLLGWGHGWSAKLEYLYVDLGTIHTGMTAALVPVCATTCANPATGTTNFDSSIHVREQIIRVGLNYKFAG